MKCNYAFLVSRFIDGELDEERIVFLKEHLKLCRVCGEEFEVLTKMKSMFTQKLDYNVSSDFTDRVLSSLPDRKFNLKERFDIWVDDIFPVARKLVPVPLILATLLILFITTQYKTVLPVTIEDVLLGNHFTQEEMLILSDNQLSKEVALELLIK